MATCVSCESVVRVRSTRPGSREQASPPWLLVPPFVESSWCVSLGLRGRVSCHPNRRSLCLRFRLQRRDRCSGQTCSPIHIPAQGDVPGPLQALFLLSGFDDDDGCGRRFWSIPSRVFVHQLAHGLLTQRRGYPIHPHFQPRPELLCLERILRA